MRSRKNMPEATPSRTSCRCSNEAAISSGVKAPAAANTGRARGSGDDRRQSIFISTLRHSSPVHLPSSRKKSACWPDMIAWSPDMRRMAISECSWCGDCSRFWRFLHHNLWRCSATFLAHAKSKVTAGAMTPSTLGRPRQRQRPAHYKGRRRAPRALSPPRWDSEEESRSARAGGEGGE